MKTHTQPTIEDLYAQIAELDDEYASLTPDPDSAEYWRLCISVKSQQRDLWRQVADRAIRLDVADWVRRATFLAWDNCNVTILWCRQFEQQCANTQS